MSQPWSDRTLWLVGALRVLARLAEIGLLAAILVVLLRPQPEPPSGAPSLDGGSPSAHINLEVNVKNEGHRLHLDTSVREVPAR